ncbi:hypothetical protein GCM10010145_52560 [Streptomyces ruber]|uniref:AraC-type arabinose-binding/dimerisation domain-containing protein n=2 Tax=Streptomyces TaxID=1883 RepID=A0A918BKQ0_9ACTN|nr:AraC family ligand binding domain-containing protein [Streptomyces ruber]GGQ76281.1 hypothetical protein GCM10010145_52560 [Streptomyces ruber]
MRETDGAAGPVPEPVPRTLCDVTGLVTAPAPAGVAWKLTEAGRQLDANVVHLPPNATVDTHVEPELDVLLFVVAGGGTVTGTGRAEHLSEGSLLWLPRGSSRSLAAGDDGLFYLTVHRRRPGLQIRRTDRPASG